MGKSRNCTWFLHCCCCCCCGDDNKEETHLLIPVDNLSNYSQLNGSRSPSKETTPSRELVGISEVKVHSDEAGVEVQEIEVSVKEEVAGQETPVIQRKQTTPEIVREVLAPSERARVDSGTFVRSSGSRSSWRMIPTVSQQAREAANAKEKLEKEEKRKSAIVTSSSYLSDGDIVFSDEAVQDPNERNIVLVPEEVGGADVDLVADESVTMTITVMDTSGPTVDSPNQQQQEEQEKQQQQEQEKQQQQEQEKQQQQQEEEQKEQQEQVNPEGDNVTKAVDEGFDDSS